MRKVSKRTVKKPVIFLASQSARRRDILRQMKVSFRVVPSRYNEKPISGLGPETLALRHARGKARGAVVPKQARFILGADTVVYCRGKILGKPRSEKEALGMLGLLSGKSHVVMTAMALYDRKRNLWITECVKTQVTVKKLSMPQKRAYIQKINPYDKAGGYAIQRGPRIVKSYVGSYSNVVGLPREWLRARLKEL